MRLNFLPALGSSTTENSNVSKPLLRDVRSTLNTVKPIAIISELSGDLKGILGSDRPGLTESVISLVSRGAVLHDTGGTSVILLPGNGRIVVKITNEERATTECQSLLYLQRNLPRFPAPRVHGLMQQGSFYFLFTSLTCGYNLENVWPRLSHSQKHGISSQIDKLLSILRTLPSTRIDSLGGVGGDGCKDVRRAVRVCREQIRNVDQFEDFIFAGAETASDVYKGLLRELVPTSANLVFTHGDIRLANIMVDEEENGVWKVAGIIDWEASGFYPDYWECIKMTNNLTPRDKSDWYKHLPKSVAQHRYPVPWLVDRLLDRNMVNS